MAFSNLNIEAKEFKQNIPPKSAPPPSHHHFSMPPKSHESLDLPCAPSKGPISAFELHSLVNSNKNARTLATPTNPTISKPKYQVSWSS